jgi:hypothetical protein
MIPLILMAAGTAMQIVGNLQANRAQAEKELANAAFYKEQAKFAEDAMFRQSDIAARNYEQRKGAQLSSYAASGVDISGSAAITIAETVAQKSEEIQAIYKKGELDTRLALSRARSSEAMAATLNDPMYNLMQGGGSALTMASKWDGKGGGGGTSQLQDTSGQWANMADKTSRTA